MTVDAVVVGLGAMGSAAAAHLSRRGARVLGLDAYEAGHRRGSSHGSTRIIRKAYFEDPAYVPLLERAYELWAALAPASGVPEDSLLRLTGGLMLGRPAAPVVAGALASAEQHGLPYELLPPAEIRRRFPGFVPEPDMVGLWEPQAGVLFPERCVEAHLRAAARSGADLRHHCPVRGWRPAGGHVVVETAEGDVEAGAVVVTAGPWAPGLLRDLGLPLQATRQVVAWFGPASPAQAVLLTPPSCPIFICDLGGTNVYGIPDLGGGSGLKAAIHERGEPCTPDSCRREVGDAELARLRDLLTRFLPAGGGRVLTAETCLYTMTPDGHFVIDRPAAHPGLVYAAGMSGHGFKFASVIGEILADLALRGETAHPIAFLSPRRFEAASPAAPA